VQEQQRRARACMPRPTRGAALSSMLRASPASPPAGTERRAASRLRCHTAKTDKPCLAYFLIICQVYQRVHTATVQGRRRTTGRAVLGVGDIRCLHVGAHRRHVDRADPHGSQHLQRRGLLHLGRLGGHGQWEGAQRRAAAVSGRLGRRRSIFHMCAPVSAS